MFKKIENGMRIGELNMIIAKRNCGESMYFCKELNKAKAPKTTEKHTK